MKDTMIWFADLICIYMVAICNSKLVIYNCFLLFLQLNNDIVNIINISMGSIIAVLMQQALQNLHP